MVFESPLGFDQENNSGTPRDKAGCTFEKKLKFHSSNKSDERRIKKDKLRTSLGFDESNLESPGLFDYSYENVTPTT